MDPDPKWKPLARALEASLANIGQTAIAPTPQATGINIVLGMRSLLSTTDWPKLPSRTVILNGTPMRLASTSSYLDYLFNFPILDISASNVSALQVAGKKDVAHLPIRYDRQFVFQRFVRRTDLDVVVVASQGSAEPARELIAQLRGRGLLVEAAMDNPAAFAELTSRAKIALLLRDEGDALAYAQSLMILAASGNRVLAQDPDDAIESAYFERAVTFCNFSELAETAQRLCDEPLGAAHSGLLEAMRGDLFEHRVIAAGELILGASSHRSSDAMPDSLLALREAAITGSIQLGINALPAIDLALGWHDRSLDVEDSLHGAEARIESLPLILLLELYLSSTVTKSLRRQLEPAIISKVAAAEYHRFSERGLQLAAAAMGQLGEIALYLNVIATSAAPLRILADTLPASTFAGLEVYDGVRRFLSDGRFRTGIAQLLAAELLWHSGQFSAAVDQYLSREARLAASDADSPFRQRISNRLGTFGHAAGARTYAKLADPISPDAPTSVIGHGTSEAKERCGVHDIAVALQRSHCYAGKKLEYGEDEIIVDSSQRIPENLILSGDIKVWDSRFAQSAARNRHVDAVAIIACYNEVDVMESVVRSFREQRIHVHVIDNWSSDGTWELLKLLEHSDEGVVVERFPPTAPSAVYNWRELLARKEEVALAYPDQWILHSDADEIRRTPWDGVDLASGLAVVEDYGCNAVDFAILNFRPVDEGFRAGMPLEDYFGFYEIGESPDLKYQIKCWKQGSHKANLTMRGGHSVIIPDKKVFPFKFICKHYPIRSQQHAERKIIADRMGRFSSEERAMGWHTQYDGIEPIECRWSWTALQRFSSVGESPLAARLVQGL
jgi:hypothetical protein